MPSSIQIFAGKTAFAHLQQHGLQAADIALIPAAAGGPKGLILQGLDQWLFGEWLPAAPRQRTLIGASIGAWRMAAASCANPVAAFQRLADLYCEQQYPEKPPAALVTQEITQLLQRFISGCEHEIATNPLQHLQILANRGRGLLASPTTAMQAKAGFASAACANLLSRDFLARHIERVIIGNRAAASTWLEKPFDHFHTHLCDLSTDNLAPALLASGTLPLVMEPVRQIPGAPAGTYWDGGMIDYHLALPYERIQSSADKGDAGLVLYPHFTDRIIPGWLDKAMPWRRAGQGRHRSWVDNVIMISPSAEFIRQLPRGKLPDRQDFFHYGLNHALRVQQWKIAIADSARMRDDFAAFIDQPDMSQVRLLNR